MLVGTKTKTVAVETWSDMQLELARLRKLTGDLSVSSRRALTVANRKEQNCVSVSPFGGDYTTIQAALDANPTVGLIVLVYSGTYTNDTINFTANRQTVKSVGKGNNTIVTNSLQVVEGGDYTGCKVIKMRINFTPTAAINGIELNNGTMCLDSCRVDLTTASNIIAAVQPHLLAITGTGELTTKFGEYTYQHTGNTGAGGIKAMFSINGGTLHWLRPCTSSMTNSGTALATTLIVDAGAGGFNLEEACDLTITDTNAAIVTGFGYIGGGGNNIITHSSLTVVGGGGNNCYAVYHAGTGILRSSHNNVSITGGLNNFGIFVGAAATFNGHMDDVRAASGNQIAGTANIASSEVDGSFTVTGTVLTVATTVAGLPAAGVAGRRSFVTDSNATVFANVVAGGGANGVPVYDDGTNWRIG